MTQVRLSQINGDEAAFRAALEAHVAAKVAQLDEVGALPPSDPFLDQFITRTHVGDPHPDVFQIVYELVDNSYPEAI